MKHHAVQKLAAALAVCVFGSVYAQEALKSTEEEYYDFLSLNGDASRPALNYRTLSDSVWRLTDDAEDTHVWRANNLGTTYTLWAAPEQGGNWFLRGIDEHITMKIYGPEWFNSFNTAAPYGQNDGALWQGRGYNTSLTAGIRFEGYGFEATIKPQLSYSQNMGFDIVKPAYSGADYADKAENYGYYGLHSIDAPQRFGNKPFFTFDWGDTEIRWSLYTFTIGFGTQPIWLGPAQINPIIHSNNAASYPKLDIGLRRQPIVIPKLNWYLGDIELRVWWGYLSESDYFDNTSDNDHNLITGFTIAYGVPFLPGLTIGLNRIMLSKWNDMNTGAIFSLLWPAMDTGAGSDQNDQRASIVIDYHIPKAGLNIYLEWGRNDFSPGLDYVIRYPFHTQGYTFGIKKSLDITDVLKGEILLEITNLESSRDYENMISWDTTFYAHHIITQGHTNRGQWLGAGIGTGGNSQYLGFKLYYPKGNAQIFIQRMNPDMDYSWFIDIVETNIRANFNIGIGANHYFIPALRTSAQIVYSSEFNPTYNRQNLPRRHNFALALQVKYCF
ncbi:MAG TPA: capsule assembly Wzi family protein [Candidatus Treponema faecavium]|nr:capsule assembly Wzi family protein [Candidatus Treponema faecavium]